MLEHGTNVFVVVVFVFSGGGGVNGSKGLGEEVHVRGVCDLKRYGHFSFTGFE